MNNIMPTIEYIKQASMYISKQLGLPIEEAYNRVVKSIQESKVKDPKVKFNYKKDNGDMEVKESTLLEYLRDVIASKDIIVPSFTTYYNTEKEKSIHAKFMAENTKNRSKFKKLAFKHKLQGDITQYLFNDTMQKSKKMFNNSLSGTYSSKSTILRNPSAHYTLTSITRCVSSIGNAYTESIVCGNKHFRTFHVTLSYLTSIITNIDKKLVNLAMDKYNLHIPSVDEIMKMIEHSSKWYWHDDTSIKHIRNFVSKLNDVDKVSIMYVNDLWNLKNYNEVLIRTMIDNITVKVKTGVLKAEEMQGIPDALEILTKLICHEEIQGKNINYQELENTTLGEMLFSTSKNVVHAFKHYDLLFKAFFYTKIQPPAIAYIKEMFRECIVLSDTDSTCGSYDQWVEWYMKKEDYSPAAIPIVGCINTIVSNVVDYGLQELSKNMNVPKENQNILKMKNEFYWPVFICGNVNKHYFSNTLIQEGNVYSQPDREIKGVHFISSASDQNIAKKVKEMMNDILDSISRNEKISLLKYVKQVADLEREILERINNGDVDIYKKDSIKDPKAYKLSQEQSPYFHHMLWNEIFKEKYGEINEPPYMVYKIPVTLDSNKKLKEYLANIEDEEFRNKLSSFLTRYKKDSIGTFRVPISIASGLGIPVELLPCIDKKRIVLDNLISAYLVLESIGFYKKDNTILIDSGY